MKKHLLSLAVVGVVAVGVVFFGGGVGVRAATGAASIQATIEQLMAQVTQLQKQLDLAEPGGGGTTPPVSVCTLAYPLHIGSTGPQVFLLQNVLAKEGSYKEKFITGYYGKLTVLAVQTFQAKNNLPATGSVDQKTADAINAIVPTYIPWCASGRRQSALTVTSPAAGDAWTVGNTYTIRWQEDSASISARPRTVSIVTDLPAPSCVHSVPACEIAVPSHPYVIAQNIPDTGSYAWTIPADLPAVNIGSEAITVSVDGAAVAGISGVFTIAAGSVTPPTLSIVQIKTTSLPNGTVGLPYLASLQATGGTGNYQWSVVRGVLPQGLFVVNGSNCVSGVCPDVAIQSGIFGTPAIAGTYAFALQATDSSGATATQDFSITITQTIPGPTSTPLAILTTSLPNGTVGRLYTASLQAIGGSGNYQWSVIGGALPAGLTIRNVSSCSSGACADSALQPGIFGVPTVAGTYAVTLQVADGSGATATSSYSIVIAATQPPSVPLSIQTTSLPGGTVGQFYSQTVTATGGSGGYSWQIVSGSLPPGILQSRNVIMCFAAPCPNPLLLRGTPTVAGTYSFVVQVTDGTTVATQPLSIVIAATQPSPAPLSIQTTSLPNGTVGQPYTAFLQATGGTGNYQWSVVSGTLPQGITVSPSGVLSGTPSIAGGYSVIFQVSDGTQTVSRFFTIAVGGVQPSPAPLSIQTTSLPQGIIGQPYTASLQAIGGSGNYQWSVVSGTLPQGLSLTGNTGSQVTIAGTPTVAGTYGFSVQVSDGTNVAARPFFLNVISTQPSITILAPAGGESWVAGSMYPILWQAQNLPTQYVSVAYVTPSGAVAVINGNVYSPSSAYGSASLMWPIPGTLSGSGYKIKVSSGDVTAYSNAFTITSTTTPIAAEDSQSTSLMASALESMKQTLLRMLEQFGR